MDLKAKDKLTLQAFVVYLEFRGFELTKNGEKVEDEKIEQLIDDITDKVLTYE